ncbi:kinase-like protein [Aspergillus indologenus CBS 114.80]|uniref:Kinase-like protein n=1 Tax=Aspergillus indologenus CBS 114.80 TaxID=1450541 RepID=A0A2V5I3Z5_9EURO|nr:kinase-like protein [Aspergillus indologenus CBS 114.80]
MYPSAFNLDARRRDFINQIIEDLRQRFVGEDDKNKRFICQKDLIEVWKDESRLLELLGPRPISLDDIRSAQEDFVAILSILVCIGATATLGMFCDIIHTSGISDIDLPLQEDVIRNLLRTEQGLTDIFDLRQYTFCPAVIDCSQNHPVQVIDESRLLPFLSKPKWIGSGGFASVDLVEVAPCYLKTSQGAVFEKPYKIACKKFEGNTRLQDFKTELSNLRNFKNSLTSQAHILQHLTTFAHGPEYYILFDYAEHGDLYQFLSDGAGRYHFREEFPGVASLETSKTHEALLYQCWALTSALHWLHNKITVKTEIIRCAHMDLKPDNILIMRDSESIVGKWMISDFGISVTQNDRRTQALSIRDLYHEVTINKPAFHEIGTYQPPEGIHVQSDGTETEGAGRRSDVWSFGCVFSEVLAWAIGREKEVSNFARERKGQAQNDSFWEEFTPNNLSPGGKEFRLRGSVTTWLNHIQFQRPLTSPVLMTWAQKIQEKILIVKKDERPDAKKLSMIVRVLYEECVKLARPDTQPGPDIQLGHDTQSALNAQPAFDMEAAFDTRSDYLEQIQPSSPGRNAPEVVEPMHPASPNLRMPLLPSTSEGRSSSSSDSWAANNRPPSNPNDKLSILQHSSKDNLASAVSRSIIQDKVPVALLYKDRIELMQAYIGDSTARDPRAMLPVNVDFISSVAVSPHGTFALVRDREIILRSGYRDYNIRYLTTGLNLDQTFTHAAFSDRGNMLFAWAVWGKQESLYVWRVDDNTFPGPHHVIHYSLQARDYQPTTIIPYDARPGPYAPMFVW